jgi:hypothetical protein
VQDKASAFEARVRACLHSTIHDIKDGVFKVGDGVTDLSKELRSSVVDIKEKVRELKQEFEIKSTLENVLLELVNNRKCTLHIVLSVCHWYPSFPTKRG